MSTSLRPLLGRPLLPWIFAVLLAAGRPSTGMAQERGFVAVHELVRGLGNTARVLMIGAHPDDEDTQLITWLARGRQVETAYLSLTRGDGGQNLIGNELGDALGVVRTEELLAARRIDGGRQYFTRAYDFGFSKSAEETFEHWPRELLLRDVVTIVRSFRPHVIVSVFSGTPRDGHGHHQVAGMLAREAFDVAGDSIRFPVRATGGIGPWTPRKLYRRWSQFQGVNPDTMATLRINVGEYNPLLGRSYAEVAGESRSQHLSQGFGSLEPKGVRWTYLQREASNIAQQVEAHRERDLFDGIDTTWGKFASLTKARTSQLDSIPSALDALLRLSAERKLHELVQPLALVHRLVSGAHRFACSGEGICLAPCKREWESCEPGAGDLLSTLNDARDRASRALLLAAGVSVEAIAQRELVALGDSLPVTFEIHNRGRAPVRILGVQIQSRGDHRLNGLGRVDSVDRIVEADSALRVPSMLKGFSITSPWWRARQRRGDMFQLELTELRHLPAVVSGDTSLRSRATPPDWEPAREMVMGEDRVHHTTASAIVEISGTLVPANAGPVVHRYADPARGEVRRPVAVVPAISVLLPSALEYLPASKEVKRTIRVHLASALVRPWRGRVALRLPAGLRADSASRAVAIAPRGEADAYFVVRGTVPEGLAQMFAVAQEDSTRDAYAQGYVPIEYPHIRPQHFYRTASTYYSSVNVDYPADLRVAYVQGVGDNVAPMLSQLDIPVSIISPDTLGAADLSRYTTLVIGPRAYDASTALRASASKVLEFARAGGTVVAQYGQYEMTEPGVLPYPITLSRPAARVTDEKAPVTFVDSMSALLRRPNRITALDFSNWVQERGLYMPREFDRRYMAPLQMNDEGEPPIRGALLVAPVGQGRFVYTTLSFFRQLPMGIPGPARLFVNLLSARPTPRVVP
jgi:LmbE family N-acetylglucosaminyl deacetylase